MKNDRKTARKTQSYGEYDRHHPVHRQGGRHRGHREGSLIRFFMYLALLGNPVNILNMVTKIVLSDTLKNLLTSGFKISIKP